MFLQLTPILIHNNLFFNKFFSVSSNAILVATFNNVLF